MNIGGAELHEYEKRYGLKSEQCFLNSKDIKPTARVTCIIRHLLLSKHFGWHSFFLFRLLLDCINFVSVKPLI